MTSDRGPKECGLRYWEMLGRAFKAERTAFTKSWGDMKIQVCLGNCRSWSIGLEVRVVVLNLFITKNDIII